MREMDSDRPRGQAPAQPCAVDLSVVVPTFNESANVAEIIGRLDGVLGPLGANIGWEVIFVDDGSPDGTADVVRRFARHDARVRLISRHNRRGLSSAVVEGGLAAAADVVAVMDGDLQHDEGVLPELFRAVHGGQADIASASRFLLEDGADGLASDRRRQISDFGIRMANRAFGLDLTDPLTGFFVMRRAVLGAALPGLSESGFKILLDIIAASGPDLRVVELPFRFRRRERGESKLGSRVLYDFALFILEKRIGRFMPLPARFLSFSLINGVGIGLHLLVLTVTLVVLPVGFVVAQLVATVVAMFFNYTVNNAVTYSDRRLRGRDYYVGFVIFSALCAVGILGNVGVAAMIHQQLGGVDLLLPALAGAVITVVWNYAATRAFVWRGSRARAAVSPPDAASGARRNVVAVPQASPARTVPARTQSVRTPPFHPNANHAVRGARGDFSQT